MPAADGVFPGIRRGDNTKNASPKQNCETEVGQPLRTRVKSLSPSRCHPIHTSSRRTACGVGEGQRASTGARDKTPLCNFQGQKRKANSPVELEDRGEKEKFYLAAAPRTRSSGVGAETLRQQWCFGTQWVLNTLTKKLNTYFYTSVKRHPSKSVGANTCTHKRKRVRTNHGTGAA